MGGIGASKPVGPEVIDLFTENNLMINDEQSKLSKACDFKLEFRKILI